MKLPILLALAFSLGAPATAQTVAPEVERLRDAALTDTLAWEITEGLTTEVGPRLAGTEAEARAREWAVAKLRSLGFSNVHVETFDMPVWVRGAERAWITAPFPQPLVVTALGNSGATPPEGIEAELVAFDSVEALEAAADEAVRGKIVYIGNAMARTQDGSGYGAYIAPRSKGPTAASRKGAAAIVIKSIGTDMHRTAHTGAQSFADSVEPIPAGALSNPDAAQVERILERGRPVRMRLVLTPRNIGVRQSGNVIAEVPGLDPLAAPVLVACHLDSWDTGTGAADDAAGCGIVAAAAKRIMDSGQPLRPIRIVWFGAEEVGLLGGKDYFARHGRESYYAIAESDFGAGRVWKVDSRLGENRRDEAIALQRALKPLGIVAGSLEKAGGSDIGPLLDAGHPGVSLNQDGTYYFDIHHTPDDTLDKVELEELRQNVAAWTAMLALLSGGMEPKRSGGR